MERAVPFLGSVLSPYLSIVFSAVHRADLGDGPIDMNREVLGQSKGFAKQAQQADAGPVKGAGPQAGQVDSSTH